MKDKIKYPYFGVKNGNTFFAILDKNYCIQLGVNGNGFGFLVFISRKKILELFQFSKEITKQEFQGRINKSFEYFIHCMPETTSKYMLLQNEKDKLISTKEEI